MSADQPGAGSPAAEPAAPPTDSPSPADVSSAAVPGAAVPGARVAAPRAASGPRRPPRPERPQPSSGFGRSSRPAVRLPERAREDDEIPLVGHASSPATVVPHDDPIQPPPGPSAVVTGRPPARPPVRTGGRRGRRVRRVVRRIDLWSVLKLSLAVYACLYVAVLATLAALWAFAYSSGTIDKVKSFLAHVGLEDYHFYGERMFRACAAIGAILVLAGVVVTVLATALVNVISEITGGIRFVVIEEDVPG